METKNRKIIIAGILTFIFNGFLLWMILKIKKKFIMIIKNFTCDIDRQLQYINKLSKQILIQFEHTSKIYLILDIIKINMPYAIQKTTTKIATTKDIMSHRDINITLLQYIEEEYDLMKIGVSNTIELCEDEFEKKKLLYMLNEINNMTTLLQTLSKDSSDEYIDHLFKEIVTSINKFKNI